MALQLGELLSERYRVVRKVHARSLDVAYAAEDVRTGEVLAVKVLDRSLQGDGLAERLASLQQIARKHAMIRSDHLVKVRDVIETKHGAVILLGVLDGKLLEERLLRSKTIPFEELHPIAEQLWLGLADIHRDGYFLDRMIPSMVFLEASAEQQPRVKIVDCEMYDLTSPRDLDHSLSAEIRGIMRTLNAPEARDPERNAPAIVVWPRVRIDIFAVTANIYLVLTGKLPYFESFSSWFDGKELRTIAEVMKTPVNPRLEAFVAQGLARNPNHRFASADEALNAWRELRQERSRAQGRPSLPSLGELEGILKVGDIISGKYTIEHVLGVGGMGAVVAALDTSLRRRVAIKVMLPRAMNVPHARERFMREARAAAAITSEHVVRIIGVDTLETGMPYMVMEHLTGSDLARALSSRGPLPIQEVVDYVLQACEAIAEAHALGLVHRDIKPLNIFLESRADGSTRVKVLDFGLSKAIAGSDGDEGSLTATGMIGGTPHYMSPEQIRSLKDVDARTDVWSIGVLLFECLAGKRPFEAETVPAIFAKILTEPPLSIRSVRPEVPRELEEIVLRCLERAAEHRTQTIAELVSALAPFGSGASRTCVERLAKMRLAGRS